MTTALALPTKAHAVLTIFGEGTLLFLVLVFSSTPWTGRRISTKRYIAICGVCAAIWVLIAAAFAIMG